PSRGSGSGYPQSPRLRPPSAERSPPSLLLLLLLVLAGQGGVALGAAAGGFAVGLQRDGPRLGGELRDGLGGGDLRHDLGAQGLAGNAAVDAAIGRHIVIVTAVSHDNVTLVGGTIVRGIEGDPAVRGRPELDPRVTLGRRLPGVIHVQVAADVPAGDLAQP